MVTSGHAGAEVGREPSFVDKDRNRATKKADGDQKWTSEAFFFDGAQKCMHEQ